MIYVGQIKARNVGMDKHILDKIALWQVREKKDGMDGNNR